MTLPAAIRDVDQLEDLLSEPSAAAIDAMPRLSGDVAILGVGGKMGPTLARMARRAMDAAGVSRRVIGVSRFPSPGLRRTLEAHGVDTVSCDLLDDEAIAHLPDAAHVIFMAGRKFGSTGDEPLTWAMNTHLPALVCRRYRGTRLVVFSTGNVYGLTAHGRGGSREEDAVAPVGEYAMSCLGRERMFEYFSHAHGIPAAILRLNYAAELRYGVLADLASRVARRETVDLTMGYFNVIWQGDANAMALAALDHASTPPNVINVAGPEELSVRRVCVDLGRRLNVDVSFTGREADDALLSNGARGLELLGGRRVDATRLLEWTADWIRRGGETLAKPTHFESRAGHF
jgi:nucleoside-diphosphate-sugar epimerase